jgi:hypothetical protein
MSSVLFSTILAPFDKTTNSPSTGTVVMLLIVFLLILIVVNSLVVSVYPNKERYDYVDGNPFTTKLLITQTSLTSIISILSCLLYIPFIYELPKHISTVYSLFSYCSNMLAFQLFLVLISMVCLVATRYPINPSNNRSVLNLISMGEDGDLSYGYCPLDAEVGPCNRSLLDRAWTVLTETIRNFTDNMTIFSQFQSGGLQGGFGFALIFAVVLYQGFVDVY